MLRALDFYHEKCCLHYKLFVYTLFNKLSIIFPQVCLFKFFDCVFTHYLKSDHGISYNFFCYFSGDLLTIVALLKCPKLRSCIITFPTKFFICFVNHLFVYIYEISCLFKLTISAACLHSVTPLKVTISSIRSLKAGFCFCFVFILQGNYHIQQMFSNFSSSMLTQIF